MCFSLELIKQICIIAIIIGVVFAVLKIIIPYAISKMGLTLGEGFNIVLTVFRVILWGMVAIIVVVICFELITCFLHWSGGISLPRR